MEPLTPPSAQAALELLPNALQGNHIFRAIFRVMSLEQDMLDEAIEQFRAGVFPQTADATFLKLHEMLFGVTVDPPLSVDQRRELVHALYQRIISDGSGISWEENVTALLGSDWTYQTHIPGDPTSPGPMEIRVFLPSASGTLSSNIADVLLRSITDSAVYINAVYESGFVIGESELGEDTL